MRRLNWALLLELSGTELGLWCIACVQTSPISLLHAEVGDVCTQAINVRQSILKKGIDCRTVIACVQTSPTSAWRKEIGDLCTRAIHQSPSSVPDNSTEASTRSKRWANSASYLKVGGCNAVIQQGHELTSRKNCRDNENAQQKTLHSV